MNGRFPLFVLQVEVETLAPEIDPESQTEITWECEGFKTTRTCRWFIFPGDELSQYRICRCCIYKL